MSPTEKQTGCYRIKNPLTRVNALNASNRIHEGQNDVGRCCDGSRNRADLYFGHKKETDSLFMYY